MNFTPFIKLDSSSFRNHMRDIRVSDSNVNVHCVSQLLRLFRVFLTDESHLVTKRVTHRDQITPHEISVKLDFITEKYRFYAIYLCLCLSPGGRLGKSFGIYGAVCFCRPVRFQTERWCKCGPFRGGRLQPDPAAVPQRKVVPAVHPRARQE